MHRRSAPLLYKSTRNEHLAPRHDIWFEKHEPWRHLRRMANLVGTGYYIPPAWYQHFRMFPPITGNYNEALTQNPSNAAEPTQVSGDKLHRDSAERRELRLELAKKSRSAASAGNRYLNQFWVRKPIDDMEAEYWKLVRTKGFSHDAAIRHVLKQHHEKQAVRARVHAIQAEEAKFTGKFITMREAMSVLNLFNAVQEQSLQTQEYSDVAKELRDRYEDDPLMRASVETRRVPKAASDPAAPESDAEASPTAAEGDAEKKEGAAKAAAAGLDAEPEFDTVQDVVVTETEGESLAKQRERMMEGSDIDADAFWYDGFAPEVEAPPTAGTGLGAKRDA